MRRRKNASQNYWFLTNTNGKMSQAFWHSSLKDSLFIAFSGISASLSSTLGIPHPPPPSLAGLGLGHHGIPPHILAAQRVGMLPGKSASTDYTRYFKRFGSSMECGSYYCKDMNYREHFHCTVLMCKDKVTELTKFSSCKRIFYE